MQKLDELEHLVVGRLLPERGKRLIDLGCGYGRLTDSYLGRFEQVVLFDGSLSLLRSAQERTNGKAIYVFGDLNHLPFREAAFDAALMVRVFQHISNPAHCLAAIQRVLCNHGCFVMNYANQRNFSRILSWIARRSTINPFSFDPTPVGTHFIMYHPGYVEDLLADTGFAVSTYQGVGLVDKIAGTLGPLGKFAPPGARLAPIIGRSIWASWVFCSNYAVKDVATSVIDLGGEIFACPVCRGALVELEDRFECKKCLRAYPIHEGIIDMRIDDREID